jgi:hypothetical protein
MTASAGSMAPKGNISGYKLRNVPQYNPQQMQIFQRLLGSLLGGEGLEGGLDFLTRLAQGDESMFEELEAPAYSSLQKSLGDIGSRFAGFGSGAIDSSAFQQATSGAAGDLAERLQSQRLGLQSDAVDRLLGLTERSLEKRPYETYAQAKPDIGGWLGRLVSKGLGTFGGPFLGKLGSRAANRILR